MDDIIFNQSHCFEKETGLKNTGLPKIKTKEEVYGQGKKG